LSGRGLCDELITRPEKSYRLCCVVVCDLQTSRMGAPYIYDISHLRVKQAREFQSDSHIFSFREVPRRVLLENSAVARLVRYFPELSFLTQVTAVNSAATPVLTYQTIRCHNTQCHNVSPQYSQERRSIVTSNSGRLHVFKPTVVRGKSVTGRVFSQSTSVYPCQYHSTNASYAFIHPRSIPNSPNYWKRHQTSNASAFGTQFMSYAAVCPTILKYFTLDVLEYSEILKNAKFLYCVTLDDGTIT